MPKEPSSRSKKKIDVKYYAEAPSLGQILKDFGFPATKNQIITFVERHDRNNVLPTKLRDIQEKEYRNASEEAGIAR